MQHSWILLVVFVLIWVLNTFLRGNEEERKAGGNRAGGAGGRSGKASAEIDRFLEEVNRRRRQNVERRQAPPSPQPAPVAAPVARGNRGSGTRTPPGRSSIGTQRGRRTDERVAAADVVLTAEPAPDAHVAEDAYRIEPVAAAAVTGSPWLLVLGLAGHGLKDLWQHRRHFVANTRWWPSSWKIVSARPGSVWKMKVLRTGSLNQPNVEYASTPSTNTS